MKEWICAQIFPTVSARSEPVSSHGIALTPSPVAACGSIQRCHKLQKQRMSAWSDQKSLNVDCPIIWTYALHAYLHKVNWSSVGKPLCMLQRIVGRLACGRGWGVSKIWDKSLTEVIFIRNERAFRQCDMTIHIQGVMADYAKSYSN